MRLQFHLPEEESVIFDDDDDIEEVVEKASNRTSMFVAWMEANKKYRNLAKDLTYAQFPQHFTFHKKEREWRPRLNVASIARLHYVPPGAGEKHYLRMLLNEVKGPRSYEELKQVFLV